MKILAILILLLLPGPPADAHERRTAVVEAVEKAGPAVVNIRTEQIVKRRSSPFFGFADPFFEEFFRNLVPQRNYKTESLGSGVIIDREGHILTNAHVIEKASRIYVALPGRNRELEATLVGMDERIDLAVIRIEGESFAHLPLGRADDLMVGETVIAIGNPLGLGHSITTGVMSAPRRRLSMGDGVHSTFIQSDALINPGNSGGPLININGELIGINTAIARQAQGIGFAIPIDTAKRVLRDLIEHGRVRPAVLGVIPGPVGNAFTRARGPGGVLVNAVEPGSPAAAAGLRVADVIMALDDSPVASTAEFLSLLRTYTPDDRVRVGLLRGSEAGVRTVRLEAPPQGYGMRYGERVFGLSVIDGRDGVTVQRVTPGSAAERAGIARGDLVAELAGERLKSVADYAMVLEGLLGQEPLRFLIVRGNRGHYIELP